jgi:hypothetical protein
MNTLINAIENEQNVTTTENGAATLKSTLKATVDFFGLGAALRTRTDEDVISLFSKAYAEDPLVAVKTLFYIRDVRSGQGERKTFRTCFNWLSKEYPQVAIKNLLNVVEFGRWDDLYCTRGTNLWNTHVLPLIQIEWFKTGTPSLMYKWLASENTSSKETKKIASEIRTFLGVSPRTYRKTLSEKRAALDIVERKMCSSNWDQINYKGVPSKAALNYKDAFEKHDSVRYKQYIEDVKSGKTTINAGTLYPYDIVEKCFVGDDSSTLDVLWNSLPDYTNGNTSNGIVVADVSGSMSGRPMAVSISLAMYISERTKGDFKDRFITFSESPKLQKVVGNNIREKVRNLQSADWGMSTNLEAVFDLILRAATTNSVPASEMPSKVYIVSDMEFNQALSHPDKTLFQNIDLAYKAVGYERPELVFWNVNAKNTQSPIRFDDRGTCLVSGCSPSILTSLLNGKIISAEQVMLDTINVVRYSVVTV